MAKNNYKVAYLIVCWNNIEIIDECLQALYKQTHNNGDIYIIDNASADGTAEYIRENHPNVKLIASDCNNGFAKGNNILIREAMKDKDMQAIALINSDAMLGKKWTSEIVDFINNKKNVAGVQGITLDYYNRRVIDAAHIFIRRDLQAVQFGYLDSFGSAHDYPRRVFGVNAAAALYTREFIEEQKSQTLFDERFFMYLEDVDVSFRALVTGWDNYYVPSAEAYHMGSVSAKKRSSTFNIQWSLRNQAALLYKNMPFATFVQFFMSALRFEKNFYKYIEEKHSKVDKGLALKSRLVGIFRLPIYLTSRHWVMKRRKISSRELSTIIRNNGIVS